MKRYGVLLGLVLGLVCRVQGADPVVSNVLSDNFDTGGTATSDLNYNQAVRQSGAAAPRNLTTSTSGNTLTADGEMNLTGVGSFTHYPDSLDPYIGTNSFSIRLKGRHNVASANWAMLSVISDVNADWNTSPMSVNVWHHDYDFIQLHYGTVTNTLPDTDLAVGFTPELIGLAIGATYDANDEHEFEIRALAESATNGTWGFYIDGAALATRLPYTFEDGAKRMSWWTADGTDAIWDDLEISTIPAAQPEYIFFDDFNANDHPNANWGYGARQTNGMVVAPYTGNPDLYSITNNRLHQYWPIAWANLDFDFADDLEDEDFEFSFKAACMETNSNWTSIYLYDDATSPDGRGDSRLGLLIQGSETPWACIIYKGVGTGQESEAISISEVATLTGVSYDKAEEHEFKFISHAGLGGTNTYDLAIDGVIVRSGIEYYFDGAERRIGMVGVMAADSGLGAYIDDLGLRIVPPLSTNTTRLFIGQGNGVNVFAYDGTNYTGGAHITDSEVVDIAVVEGGMHVINANGLTYYAYDSATDTFTQGGNFSWGSDTARCVAVAVDGTVYAGGSSGFGSFVYNGTDYGTAPTDWFNNDTYDIAIDPNGHIHVAQIDAISGWDLTDGALSNSTALTAWITSVNWHSNNCMEVATNGVLYVGKYDGMGGLNYSGSNYVWNGSWHGADGEIHAIEIDEASGTVWAAHASGVAVLDASFFDTRFIPWEGMLARGDIGSVEAICVGSPGEAHLGKGDGIMHVAIQPGVNSWDDIVYIAPGWFSVVDVKAIADGSETVGSPGSIQPPSTTKYSKRWASTLTAGWGYSPDGVSWSDPDNWYDPVLTTNYPAAIATGLPKAGDIVHIDTVLGGFTLPDMPIINAEVADAPYIIDLLSGQLDIVNGGSLSVAKCLTVGRAIGATGSLNMSGNGHVVAGKIHVGLNWNAPPQTSATSGGNGIVNMGGDSILQASNLVFGQEMLDYGVFPENDGTGVVCMADNACLIVDGDMTGTSWISNGWIKAGNVNEGIRAVFDSGNGWTEFTVMTEFEVWTEAYDLSGVDPEADPDSDGFSIGAEFIAGTDPTNSASFFRVTTDTAEVGEETHFVIEWTAVTGRVYNVLWTPSLAQEFQPLETGIQYPQHSYTDTVHSAESSGYYRVVVMRADYDLDGDGLPNDWESQYAVADAYVDGDGDGFNNLAEFISGTDPTNAMSYFTAANSVAEVNGTNCFVVEWISIPDRLYSVQWSTNLISGFQTLETRMEHPQSSYTDMVHGAETKGYYKVDVELK